MILWRLKRFLSEYGKDNIIIVLSNLLLRASTLGSKFLLVIFLAKYLSAENMGRYGVFSATINYSFYLLGVDYYIYANREIIGRSETEWPVIIRDQFVFYLISYTVFLPFLFFVFVYDLISWQYVIWFYIILIFEHLAQETHRLLVAVRKPLYAGLLGFVRSGAWVYIVLIAMASSSENRNLVTVWICWASGVAVCSLIALPVFCRLDWAILKKKPLNWKWIGNGLKKTFPFFISTLALKGIYTGDRYFLKIFCGNSAVGVYTFYGSIANIIQHFVDAAVVVNFYPKLIVSYKAGDIKKFRFFLRQMAVSIIIFATVLTGILSAFILPALRYVLHNIDESIYIESISVFWFLLLVNGITVIGYIPHYALYATGKDREIISGTIFSFLICMTCYCVLIPAWGGIGAAVSLLISSSFLCIYKQKKVVRGNE